MTTGFDVVVVGGGTAGAVLAARLSEDAARRVLLLEAGPAPASIGDVPTALLDAGRVPGAHGGDPLSWWYPAELMPGRAWTVSRGRVLGGSTATNGAYFIRPRRVDVDEWSDGVGPWAWDRVLPQLRALERDLDLGGSAVHGERGPVPVRRGGLDHPAAAAFVAGARAAGFADEADKNDEGDPGVGPVPSNAVDGVRWSTFLTHLLPALGRPNLTVRGGSVARRIGIGRGRATTVTLTTGEVVHGDEIVLAAGALASPVLLLRSGVGPASSLRAADLPVAVDAPGVGAAFGDHPQVVVEWRPPVAAPRPAASWMGAAVHTADDVEVLQSLRPMVELTGGIAPADAPLPLLVSTQAPVLSGRIGVGSADGPARIEFRSLRDQAARRRLRDAVRVAAAIVPDGSLVGLDRAVLRDEQSLDGWIRERIGTALHTCATVPFRLPDGAPGPVDEVGRVRGIDGLRVADTSILPAAPRRGPAVAAVLVGEVVAAAMRSTP